MHKTTYALGIAGYMVVCLTLLGVNLMFRIGPETAMEFGVTVLFYGLYFGVLGRDFAEMCADKIASKLGVSRFFFFTFLSYYNFNCGAASVGEWNRKISFNQTC